MDHHDQCAVVGLSLPLRSRNANGTNLLTQKHVADTIASTWPLINTDTARLASLCVHTDCLPVLISAEQQGGNAFFPCPSILPSLSQSARLRDLDIAGERVLDITIVSLYSGVCPLCASSAPPASTFTFSIASVVSLHSPFAVPRDKLPPRALPDDVRAKIGLTKSKPALPEYAVEARKTVGGVPTFEQAPSDKVAPEAAAAAARRAAAAVNNELNVSGSKRRTSSIGAGSAGARSRGPSAGPSSRGAAGGAGAAAASSGAGGIASRSSSTTKRARSSSRMKM